jgi:energy-coupling factor transport system ATP-binding protein
VALTLSGVGHVYGAAAPWATRALEGVDVELEPGGLTLVLGPTGSGKSTLLLAAAGLLRPTEGTVSCDGVHAGDGGFGGRVGLVFQDPERQLFAETVLADVAFGPRNLGADGDEADAAARSALERVGLDPARYAGRSPFSLSGGEARRVAIAGVLAMDPRYLLMDEPTAGLDADGRSRVDAIVAEARGRSGVLLVTHDPGELLAEADRLVVLEDGHVSLDGTVAEALDAAETGAASWDRWPDIVRVQLLARARVAEAAGSDLELPPSLDVSETARRLARAAGRA